MTLSRREVPAIAKKRATCLSTCELGLGLELGLGFANPNPNLALTCLSTCEFQSSELRVYSSLHTANPTKTALQATPGEQRTCEFHMPPTPERTLVRVRGRGRGRIRARVSPS